MKDKDLAMGVMIWKSQERDDIGLMSEAEIGIRQVELSSKLMKIQSRKDGDPETMLALSVMWIKLAALEELARATRQ